jgi:hypothetical protein
MKALGRRVQSHLALVLCREPLFPTARSAEQAAEERRVVEGCVRRDASRLLFEYWAQAVVPSRRELVDRSAAGWPTTEKSSFGADNVPGAPPSTQPKLGVGVLHTISASRLE